MLTNISESLFTDDKMRASLPPDVYERLVGASKSGAATSKEDANAIASALLSFATERGASKFCHHFSPVRFQGLGLGGAYAGKNDLFITYDFSSPLEQKPIVTGENWGKPPTPPSTHTNTHPTHPHAQGSRGGSYFRARRTDLAFRTEG